MAVKTKMLTVAVHADFARTLDGLIAESKLYSSRSEFLKDAIRKNYLELIQSDPSRMRIRQAAQELAELARKRGYAGKKPTREERDRLAAEFMRGLKP